MDHLPASLIPCRLALQGRIHTHAGGTNVPFEMRQAAAQIEALLETDDALIEDDDLRGLAHTLREWADTCDTQGPRAPSRREIEGRSLLRRARRLFG